ncbi:hypothetical protein NKH19_27615 [Mesorhizobium sp. M1338]|uniref:hypothetical protein n=1 Tax=Mesorhizobium sp. M1338 TaxID=2957085 RepID=UPI003338917F
MKRILALGDLSPKIREAYRREEIDTETVQHLTMASVALPKAGRSRQSSGRKPIVRRGGRQAGLPAESRSEQSPQSRLDIVEADVSKPFYECRSLSKSPGALLFVFPSALAGGISLLRK